MCLPDGKSAPASVRGYAGEDIGNRAEKTERGENGWREEKDGNKAKNRRDYGLF